MADHIRKQLRAAVKAAVTGLTTTGARVFDARVYPLQAAELPALVIYVSDRVDPLTVDVPDLQRRDMDVRIEGYASAATNVHDTLDLIGKEVEIALSAALTVAGASVTLTYTGSDVDGSAEGDAPKGVIVMRFITDLYTAAGAPDALIQS